MDERAAVSLSAVLSHDIDAVEKLHSRLLSLVPELQKGAGYRELAAIGYCMHNIYNALENSFDQISRTCENHVVDQAQWHKELLGKMFLDMLPLRPRVFRENLHRVLNDLRGFRHLFRHAYDFELDARRLKMLVEDWTNNRETIQDSLRAFALQISSSSTGVNEAKAERGEEKAKG